LLSLGERCACIVKARYEIRLKARDIGRAREKSADVHLNTDGRVLRVVHGGGIRFVESRQMLSERGSQLLPRRSQ
jgi:hypothetical protein